MKRDVKVINKRKKLWDIMGFGYKSPNKLYKNHSLNCGCSICRAKTFYKRKKRRDFRHRLKIEINTIRFDW